jgi:hypothetical protein
MTFPLLRFAANAAMVACLICWRASVRLGNCADVRYGSAPAATRTERARVEC